jgi:hypothetical protein
MPLPQRWLQTPCGWPSASIKSAPATPAKVRRLLRPLAS